MLCCKRKTYYFLNAFYVSGIYLLKIIPNDDYFKIFKCAMYTTFIYQLA